MTEQRCVGFGEVLMRIADPSGVTPLASPSLHWHPGGAEANVLVGLAQLGHRASLVSALPHNALGAAVTKTLRAEGVTLHQPAPREGRLGLYFHNAGAGLRGGAITYDRAGSVFATTPADHFGFADALAEANWAHVSGVTPAIGPESAEAACVFAETAAALTVPVSFDFNHRASMWAGWGGDPAPFLRRIMQAVTLVFGNDHDLAHVLDVPEAERTRTLAHAARAFDAFPRLQALATARRSVRSVEHHTLEAELVTRQGQWTTPPVQMTAIVDRIGGGDAFSAGLIDGLLRQRDPQTCVDRALAAAVLKHYVPGDFPQHSDAALDAFNAERPGDVKR